VPRNLPADLPANEKFFPVSEIGDQNLGLSLSLVYNVEKKHGLRLRSLKLPGGPNTRRLTCRSWALQFLSEANALSEAQRVKKVAKTAATAA
jgi:hypothetical protein